MCAVVSAACRRSTSFSRDVQTLVCVSYRNPAVTLSWVQSSRRMPVWCVEAKTPPVCTTRVCTRATVWRQVGYTLTHTHTRTMVILSPRGINCSSFRPTRSGDNSSPTLCFPSQVLLVNQVESKRLLFSDKVHINHSNTFAKQNLLAAIQE